VGNKETLEGHSGVALVNVEEEAGRIMSSLERPWDLAFTDAHNGVQSSRGGEKSEAKETLIVCFHHEISFCWWNLPPAYGARLAANEQNVFYKVRALCSLR